MESGSLLLRFFILYRRQNVFICEELNKDGLGHNKHRINVWILLGWTLEGRVGRATGNLHFFYFANTSYGIYHLNTPDQIFCNPTTPQFKLFMNPPLTMELLHLSFNQSSELDKPILSNPAVSYLWPVDVARAKCRKWSCDWPKIFRWSIWALTGQKPCLYITKQSFLMASPSAFTLL